MQSVSPCSGSIRLADKKKVAVQNALATSCYWSMGLGQESYELSLLGDRSHSRILQVINILTGSKHGNKLGQCLLHMSWPKGKNHRDSRR